MLKRAFDVLAAAIGVALCAPLWCVVALLVLLLDGRPVIFRQARLGKNGVPFAMWKFRTMVVGRPGATPRGLPVGRPESDPRRTALGALLRRTALDETPQLLNVLRGEMSLVGPRPLPATDCAARSWLEHTTPAQRARHLAWLKRRHEVLPGITGLWQVSSAPVADIENWMRCDLDYVARQSAARDLRILLRTPGALLRGRKTRTRDGAVE